MNTTYNHKNEPSIEFSVPYLLPLRFEGYCRKRVSLHGLKSIDVSFKCSYGRVVSFLPSVHSDRSYYHNERFKMTI